MPFDPDDYSALARKLFDPSGWKERVYGDPTVRVLIQLTGTQPCHECGSPGDAYHPGWGKYSCLAHRLWGKSEPALAGLLLPVPRPASEVADAVLAYRERLLAFSVPDDPELWRAADHVARIARQLSFPGKLSLV